MICEVGYWEAAAYILAAFGIWGIMWIVVMAAVTLGSEK